MSYIDKLNPTQKEAVLHTEGPLLIFAGAGSGKTRVLTYRVAHLIEQGIDPYHIVAITFTNKAAKEMRERITQITAEGDQVWVSTFHAACTRILRREIEVLGYTGNFSIYDTADTTRLIKDCVKELNLNEANYPAKSVAHVISAQKNELISPAEYERTTAGSFREGNIANIYDLYQKRLKAANALDFDDIIFKTVELLRDHDDIRLKYQNRFRYVMVDEYQDTNHAQYELVRLFSGYAQNLCVVGDDDQSIYGWRGANIENILRFEKDYPGTKVVKLEENYRSSQTILDAANAVINNNESRAEKQLWTQNGKGEQVRVYMATNAKDEGAFVAKVVGEEVGRGSAKYNDFAVLYRANAQSNSVEEALVSAGIPYRMFGGVRFYEHMEIKDILAYLKAINNPYDDIAFLRIINVPRRGIGAATINKMQMFAYENGISLSGAMQRAAEVPGLGKKSAEVVKFWGFMMELFHFSQENSVASLIQKILDDTKYVESFDPDLPETEDRLNNLNEFLAKARAFGHDSDDASLGRFLEDVALVADVDNYEASANAVAMMTLHSAKGLEFNAVFIVGCEEHLFPSTQSIENSDLAKMEEERRLCYVGFTRARHRLYVTHALSRLRYDGRVVRNAPSRFLGEVPLQYMVPVNAYGKPKAVLQSAARSTDDPLAGMTSRMAANNKKSDSLNKPRTMKATFDEILSRPAPSRPIPKNKTIDFKIGDMVNVQKTKYGVGEVMAIEPAGADFEVTINYDTVGKKKFMANLLNITKV